MSLLDTTHFALIVDDPDGSDFVHLNLFNIPADTTEIPKQEGGAQTISYMGDTMRTLTSFPAGAGTLGKNGWGQNAWGGPCPPAGTHSYHFKIYALSGSLLSPVPPGPLTRLGFETNLWRFYFRFC